MSDPLDLNAICEDWQEFAAETHVYRRARETITALIAEVERLRDELATAERAGLCGNYDAVSGSTVEEDA